MLIYLHKNYDRPNIFRQTPLGSGKWKDITVTTIPPKECDYVVVLNHPTEDIHVKCRKGGRILIIQEPPFNENNYFTDYFPYFDIVITAFDKRYSPKIMHVPAALPWLVDKTFEELNELQPNENPLNKASWITSTKNLYVGHEARLNFLEQLKKRGGIVDLYGRGIQSIENKFDGIYPYKYSLAIENYSDENYWTEKIADVFLSWSMPFYFGCKNISAFFPDQSYVEIDIHQPEEAFAIIEKTIKDKFWDKHKNAIAEARQLILNKYQFFPFIGGLIQEQGTDTQRMINAFIPVHPNKGLINKIRAYFK